MSPIKLTYFNLQGKGETIRLILAAANVSTAGRVDYEDTKTNFEQWGPMKETTPFGQLPLMNIDGEELAQSGTIVRYLARKYDLAGDGEIGFAHADMMFEHVNDWIKEFILARFPKSPEQKQEQAEKIVQEF